MAGPGPPGQVPESYPAKAFSGDLQKTLGTRVALFHSALRRRGRQLWCGILRRRLASVVSALLSQGVSQLLAEQDPHRFIGRGSLPPAMAGNRFPARRRTVQESLEQREDGGCQHSCRIQRVGSFVFLVHPRETLRE